MTGHRTFLMHNMYMLEQQTWDNVPGVNTTNFLNNCRSPASTACYTYLVFPVSPAVMINSRQHFVWGVTALYTELLLR